MVRLLQNLLDGVLDAIVHNDRLVLCISPKQNQYLSTMAGSAVGAYVFCALGLVVYPPYPSDIWFWPI